MSTKNKVILCLPVFILFNCIVCLSQDSNKRRLDIILTGAVDFHIHSSPDVTDRSLTDFEIAALAQRRGLKAIVIKNHYSNTVGRAVLVNIAFDKIKVFGGVVLNKSVGGINPEAVIAMYKMSAEYGKIVWFPTMDAAYYKKKLHQSGEGLTILKDNKISPQTIEVLKIIAKENLVLATGHLSPEEILLMLPEAKKQGVNKILITHAMGNAPGLLPNQMREAIKMGAILELTYLSYLSAKKNTDTTKSLTLAKMAQVIKELGAEHFLVSSDLGQVGNPPPPDGLKIFVKMLMAEGISPDEIDWMIKTNPGKLLGVQ